jgi:Fe-S cluster assembly protein SufB
VKKWLGKVVPQRDNFFATLNSAVFSDGTFVYIPEGVRCPMELSTYFRINAENTGQFERTLIIAEKGSYVSYLEGCTAPMRDENQLHAAVVELVALEDAEIKYSTVQNWYPGNAEGLGRDLQLRHQARAVPGRAQQDLVDPGRDRQRGDLEVPELRAQRRGFGRRVLLGRGDQQLPAGRHRHQDDPQRQGTRSTIVSKGISAGKSNNTYRGLVRVAANADGVRNFTQCDSLLLGSECGAHTVPYIEVKNPTAQIEHEATTSKISDDQLFYAMQRGLGQEEAVALIVNGFAKEVLQQLPMEFAVEAQKLLGISLEGSVG